jgi:hypothetical protein
MHLFLKFHHATNYWNCIPQEINLSIVFFSMFAGSNDNIKASVLATLWSIWRNHNALLWHHNPFDILRSCLLAHDTIRDCNWCNIALKNSLF